MISNCCCICDMCPYCVWQNWRGLAWVQKSSSNVRGGSQSSIFLLYSVSTYLGLCACCWILMAQHDVGNSWVYSTLQSSPFIVLKLKMKQNASWETFLNPFIDWRSPSTSVDLSRCKWVYIMWGLIKLHSVCCDFVSLHKEFLNGAKRFSNAKKYESYESIT